MRNRDHRVLPSVHRATTREEREAIYRFRYAVYFEESGRLLGSPDHARRWVRDADDEAPTTTLLYTGTPERITATVRLRHWSPGAVPAADIETLSLDRVPNFERRHLAEIERLMVRPSVRGKLLVASLVQRSYEILVGEHRSEMVFCYCSPGLLHFYRRIAMRPYGGRLVKAPDGLMIPLVSVTSDRDYYREIGSHLASMVDRYYDLGRGPGTLPPIDLDPLRPIFAAPGVAIEAGEILDTTERALGEAAGRWRSPLLDALTDAERRELVGRGLVVDVEAGTLVTRRGFRETELFVVLGGTFSIDEQPAAEGFGAGDSFGEESLLHDDGRRRRSVRARTDGTLLVLRGPCLDKLLRRRPELITGLLLRRLAIPARQLADRGERARS